MNLQEFRMLMESTPNKIAAIRENSSKFEFSMEEIISIVNDIFTDSEKVEFLSEFKKVEPKYRLSVMKSIDSDDVKIQVIKNDELTEGLYQYNYPELLMSLHDAGKLRILHDKEFLDSKGITIFNIMDMIKSMTDASKDQVLNDAELKEMHKLTENNYKSIIYSMGSASIEQLLENKEKLFSLISKDNSDTLSSIAIFITKVQDENKRFELADEYALKPHNVAEIAKSCSDVKKKEVLLSDKYAFNFDSIEQILVHFDIPNLFDFIRENPEFLKEKEVYIHRVVKQLSKEKQLEFVAGMENIGISLPDKLKILVVLKDESKAEIDRTGMNERYLQALEMNLNTELGNANYGNLDVNLDSDFSRYQGLDELIRITPQDVPFDEHYKLIKLAKACPNLRVSDKVGTNTSTGQEFVNAEEWISDVLSNIKEDWSDIQKAAYIDYRIGKKISYTPDFDTEVADEDSARLLWRIIDSGYGVCNGIAQLEQYLLSLVGIESERVSSGRHSFLKVKNIEIPREDGTTVKGNTVFDPTWNLTAHRYDACPDHFARSYEEIRKFDILDDGTDEKCHKNDEAFQDGTIEIERKVLREIYRSIGLAKENGDFPITNMMDESNRIAAQDIPINEIIAKQLELLSNYHPDFSTCQNSTIKVISGNLLDHSEMNFENIVVSRVYNRSDENRTPAIFVYYNAGKEEEGFFVAEAGSKSFSHMNKEEFIVAYECYDKDMEIADGFRPWEDGVKKVKQDLSRSSGAANNTKQVEGDAR